MPPNPLLDSALAAADRGCHVFPVTPGAKKPPAVKDWENRATLDPDRIRRCWSAGPYNIGIACGPSGLVVVDLDLPKGPDDRPPARWALPGITSGHDVFAALCEEHGQPYPDGTFTVATSGGSTHLYFTAPPGARLRNTSGDRGNGLGWKVDTRAGGGYVVAPGSLITARPYTVVRDTAPTPLPPWLLALLTPALASPTTPAPAVTGRGVRNRPAYADAALRNEATNVAHAPEGTRNWTLTRAARALGRFVANGQLQRADVEQALKAGAEQAGLPPRDARATITSALDWSVAHNPAHPS
ncbi:bifunctional DNA primase/polymerase [Kitasatospora sp. NPDC089913]|uniref:bifunctional DNA primase/polymerase n=1 Tax=Kitasatospora sp. NPDC089913 TaxID=3364080 RepID=UPI0037FC6E0A